MIRAFSGAVPRPTRARNASRPTSAASGPTPVRSGSRRTRPSRRLSRSASIPPSSKRIVKRSHFGPSAPRTRSPAAESSTTIRPAMPRWMPRSGPSPSSVSTHIDFPRRSAFVSVRPTRASEISPGSGACRPRYRCRRSPRCGDRAPVPPRAPSPARPREAPAHRQSSYLAGGGRRPFPTERPRRPRLQRAVPRQGRPARRGPAHPRSRGRGVPRRQGPRPRARRRCGACARRGGEDPLRTGQCDGEPPLPPGHHRARRGRRRAARDHRPAEGQDDRGHRVRRPAAVTTEEACGLERGGIGIDVQIEDATGLVHCEAIAAAPRVEALHFGPGDFSASVGIPTTTIGGSPEGYPGDHLNYVYSRILIAARAAGVQAIDGPYGDLGDDEGLRTRARLVRALGYDGKWVDPPRADRDDQRGLHADGRRARPRAGARGRLRDGHDGRGALRRRDGRRGEPEDGRRGSFGPVALRDVFRPVARRMADDTRYPKRQPVGHDVRIRVVLKPIPR